MKTFDQLTTAQKKRAIDSAMFDLMEFIADGTVSVTLASRTNHKRLQNILSKSRKKESVRLAQLHLMHDKEIRTEIYRLAVAAAGGSNYTDSGEPIRAIIDDETDFALLG